MPAKQLTCRSCLHIISDVIELTLVCLFFTKIRNHGKFITSTEENMNNHLNKTCATCNHFVRHYIISDKADLESVNCGTCNKCKNIKKHKHASDHACKKWEKSVDLFPITSCFKYERLAIQLHELVMILKYRETHTENETT